MELLDVKLPPLWIGGERFDYQVVPLTKRSELFSTLLKSMREEVILLPSTDVNTPSFQFVWLYLNGAIDNLRDSEQYIPADKIDWEQVVELFNYFAVPLEANIMMEMYLSFPAPEDIMGVKTAKRVEEYVGNRYRSIWSNMAARQKVDVIYDANRNGGNIPSPVLYTILTYDLSRYTFEDVKRDPSIIERERKAQTPEVEHMEVNILYEFERDLIHTVLNRSFYVSVDNDYEMYRTDTLVRVPAEVQEAAFNHRGLHRIDDPGGSDYTVTEYRISM